MTLHENPDQRQYGRYRLLAEIGRGGMAEVFLAITGGPVGFNKLFVLKRPRPEMLDHPNVRGMFLNEAQIAARLNHRNIIQVYEVGSTEGEEAEGTPYLVMEYLEGQPLSRLRRKMRPQGPSPELIVEVLRDVLTGLHYVHEFHDIGGESAELVHRDVTPHNIFLTYDGQVKLLDFGIAKQLDADHGTLAGILKGKIKYMSPEQARAEPVDRRTDIFSVGVVLYNYLFERSLWSGVSDLEVLRRIGSDQIPPLPDDGPRSVPAELRAVCRRALAPAAADRYPTAEAMREDLDAWLSGRDVPGPQKRGEMLEALFVDKRDEIRELIQLRIKEAVESDAAAVPKLRLMTSSMEVYSGSDGSDSFPKSVVSGSGSTKSLHRSSSRPLGDTAGGTSMVADGSEPQTKRGPWIWVIAAVAMIGAGILGAAVSGRIRNATGSHSPQLPRSRLTRLGRLSPPKPRRRPMPSRSSGVSRCRSNPRPPACCSTAAPWATAPMTARSSSVASDTS